MTPEQLLNAKLQKLENETLGFHRMTLTELSSRTGVPESVWSTYLQREDVRQRIHSKMNEDIEIAHRASLSALAKEAQRGNVQAIKELNNLSGILNQNNNKQIVTHYIPRPDKEDTAT